jgi:hypothetical protein
MKTMKNLLILSFLMLSFQSYTQPEIDSWMLSDGTIAQYWYQTMMQPAALTSTGDSANVQQVCYTADTVWIRSTGLAEIMGPYLTPQVPLNQNNIIKLPRNPQEELGQKQEVAIVGGIGMLINGVEFQGLGDNNSYDGTSSNIPATAGGKEIWNQEALYSEGATLDTILNAHAGFGGSYHCHGLPKSLLPLNASKHSPIIGFAYDGFPIYGPFGYSDPLDTLSAIARMETGYALRTSMTTRDSLPEANGTLNNPADWGPTVSAAFPLGMYAEDYAYAGIGTLDEHNGRFCHTPEYPNGIYAYFTTVDATLSIAEFPYLLGTTYYGEVVTENVRPQLSVTFSYGNNCAMITPVTTIDNKAEQVQMFPNPTASNLNINWDINLDIEQIKVFNTMGQVVLEIGTNYQENNTIINTKELQTGLYNLSLFSTKGIITKSFVVTK